MKTINFLFQVIKEVEKAEVLTAFFTLVFTGKICLQKSQTPKTHKAIEHKFTQPDDVYP